MQEQRVNEIEILQKKFDVYCLAAEDVLNEYYKNYNINSKIRLNFRLENICNKKMFAFSYDMYAEEFLNLFGYYVPELISKFREYLILSFSYKLELCLDEAVNSVKITPELYFSELSIKDFLRDNPTLAKAYRSDMLKLHMSFETTVKHRISEIQNKIRDKVTYFNRSIDNINSDAWKIINLGFIQQNFK